MCGGLYKPCSGKIMHEWVGWYEWYHVYIHVVHIKNSHQPFETLKHKHDFQINRNTHILTLTHIHTHSHSLDTRYEGRGGLGGAKPLQLCTWELSQPIFN